MMYISMDLLNSPTQHHSTWARTQICIEHVHNNFKVKILSVVQCLLPWWILAPYFIPKEDPLHVLQTICLNIS